MIYMKSHCEAPDYEDYCEAENKHEAVLKFQKKLSQYEYWGYDEVARNVEQV